MAARHSQSRAVVIGRTAVFPVLPRFYEKSSHSASEVTIGQMSCQFRIQCGVSSAVVA